MSSFFYIINISSPQPTSNDKMFLYASIPSLVCLLCGHFIFQKSSIVSEQWIQIRHLEQALEMSKVCFAGVPRMKILLLSCYADVLTKFVGLWLDKSFEGPPASCSNQMHLFEGNCWTNLV